MFPYNVQLQLGHNNDVIYATERVRNTNTFVMMTLGSARTVNHFHRRHAIPICHACFPSPGVSPNDSLKVGTPMTHVCATVQDILCAPLCTHTISLSTIATSPWCSTYKSVISPLTFVALFGPLFSDGLPPAITTRRRGATPFHLFAAIKSISDSLYVPVRGRTVP